MLRRWLWLLALPLSLRAQSTTTTIVATVGAARDSSPLSGVEVMVMDSHRQAVTDWSGEARLAGITPGLHRVRVRKLGFAPVDVQLAIAGDSIAPVFLLAESAIALDTMRVVAPSVRENLRDFESRRKLGIGRFLTQSQLDKEGNSEFAIVASARFPGIQAKTDEAGKYHLVSTRSGCGYSPAPGDPPPGITAVQNGGQSNSRSRGGADSKEAVNAVISGSCSSSVCPIKVFLDGIILQPDDFDFVHTWDLAAVEYYTGASMPARYRVLGAGCGVMLLWSR